ncbi:MAG: outer membrane beta-barrel protein [Bacteroidetes bacterium]|nr:outer membrane beta-barrel protein [Bacteroidota bacterium]
MKKFLYTIASVIVLAGSANAQEPAKDKGADFDKKFRFGLRITPQPTWFTSSDNNNKPYGARFGFGFGLNMEFRLSNIVAFLTGVGGDFEGGKYQFRQDPANNYAVRYWQNNAGDFVEPKKNSNNAEVNASNTVYLLKDRTIKTTFVTIPAILKLSTNEYSGLKYFGMFGVELGIRVKATATDNYINSYKYPSTGVAPAGYAGEGASSQSNININKDASLIPIRLGLNVGGGTEYRIGGSTTAFISVNYFRSFTNLMRNDSKYLVYNVDTDITSGNNTYSFVKQNIIMSAIRINLGIMF